MGQSTDAILCYGFHLSEELGEDEETRREIENFMHEGDEFITLQYGLKEPSGSGKAEEWRCYYGKKSGVLEKSGVDLVEHCCDEEPMYVLAARGSVQKAARGYPIDLGQSVAIDPSWREKLVAFCELSGIPFREPQLILFSHWR